MGHVGRIGEVINKHRILVGVPEGKIHFGELHASVMVIRIFEECRNTVCVCVRVCMWIGLSLLE